MMQLPGKQLWAPSNWGMYITIKSKRKTQISTFIFFIYTFSVLKRMRILLHLFIFSCLVQKFLIYFFFYQWGILGGLVNFKMIDMASVIEKKMNWVFLGTVWGTANLHFLTPCIQLWSNVDLRFKKNVVFSRSL